MKLNLAQTYKRIDNILYCEDIAIVKFIKDQFPDFDSLTLQGIRYMQKYIDMYPQYCEVLEGWIVSDDIIEHTNFHLQDNCERIENQIVREQQIQSITTFGVEGHDPNSSRLEQVRYCFSKGVTSASIIASTIDANPSYVQRLLKQIQNEK